MHFKISAQLYMGVILPLMLLVFGLTVAVIMRWCMKRNTDTRIKMVMGVCIAMVIVIAGAILWTEYR